MMLPCINKGCRNMSYVPKRYVEKYKMKEIICNNCSSKVQKNYLKLSSRERKKLEAEADKIIADLKL